MKLYHAGLFAIDLTAYVPLAGNIILAGFLLWRYVKAGRLADREKERQRLLESTEDARLTREDATKLAQVRKERIDELERLLQEAEEKRDEFIRFNYRLQGEIDKLEERVSGIEKRPRRKAIDE